MYLIFPLAIALALPTFGVLFIRMRLAKDYAARKAVPVKGTAVAFMSLMALILLAGFITSNLHAHEEGYVSRGRSGAEALLMKVLESTDPAGPAADISAGATLTDDQLNDIGRGLEVELPTSSGTPATIQLHSTDSGMQASVSYDGEELDLGLGTMGYPEVSNSWGYPQLIPLPGLTPHP